MNRRKSRSNSPPRAWSSCAICSSVSMPGIIISCSAPCIIIFTGMGLASGTGGRPPAGHDDGLGVVTDHAGDEVDVSLGKRVATGVGRLLGGGPARDLSAGRRVQGRA